VTRHERQLGAGSSPSTTCRSVRQTPQAATFTRICPGPGRATFQGFRRPDGRAGTRNYIGILTSVNCSATVARFIADAFNRSGILDDYPNIDGVVPFVQGDRLRHGGKGGEGFDVLQRTLWGYARHPNLAGVADGRPRLRGEPDPFLIEAYGLKAGERDASRP
jgi:altronate hydrolase